jgi:hypothetical protein
MLCRASPIPSVSVRILLIGAAGFPPLLAGGAAPSRKGRPCRRRALADSEYYYSHDPRRALER